MPIPLAQIISAAAPLVMNAVDLYRRRHDATAGPVGASGDSLPARLRGLEESDLEQSRLISELSRSLEALARAQADAVEENRRHRATIQRLLWTVAGLVAVSVTLSIWAVAR
jgi:hypothetical protein